jgi:hypothetical protein
MEKKESSRYEFDSNRRHVTRDRSRARSHESQDAEVPNSDVFYCQLQGMKLSKTKIESHLININIASTIARSKLTPLRMLNACIIPTSRHWCEWCSQEPQPPSDDELGSVLFVVSCLDSSPSSEFFHNLRNFHYITFE